MKRKDSKHIRKVKKRGPDNVNQEEEGKGSCLR